MLMAILPLLEEKDEGKYFKAESKTRENGRNIKRNEVVGGRLGAGAESTRKCLAYNLCQ